jgi:hypothetical protein
MVGRFREACAQAIDPRRPAHRHQRSIVGIGQREAAADLIAAALPRSAEPRAADQDDTALAIRGHLRLDGDLVTDMQLADIRSYFAGARAKDPDRRNGTYLAPDAIPAETHVAYYRDRVVLGCPHLTAIANDVRVLRVWWSMPTPGQPPERAELFHRDLDDFRFIKLFVYLTDVDRESGPHVFAVGSHRKDVLTAAGRRYTDTEVADAVGESSFLQVTGRAGTAFLEATHGLHRATQPTVRPRMIFSALYSLRPTVYGPRRPVGRLAGTGFDPYVNRLFLR